MKMYNIENVDSFFKAVGSCKGKVELVTDSGLYNLKSALSQIIASAKVFSNGPVRELELKFSDGDDCLKMMKYCMSGC